MKIYKDYTLCSFVNAVVVLKMFCYKKNGILQEVISRLQEGLHT